MPIPANKNELIDAIEDSFTKVYKDFEAAPKELCHDATLTGHVRGTAMSMHNLLSYLVGWNKLVLKWLEFDVKGKEIGFPETGFQWNELGALAQKFYRDHEGIPFDQLLQDFKSVKQRIVAFVNSQTDAALYKKSWYKTYTMGRMIQLNTSSPYKNARTRLRKWMRENTLT